jgi:MinD-like ATPase involved in chromosome partitioning or flagellar assembly
MAAVRYDDSLPILLATLASSLSVEEIAAGVVIRDISGRLSFFAGSKISEEVFSKLEQDLHKALGPYARQDRVLAPFDDFGSAVLSDTTAYTVVVDGIAARVVDRRLVGMDWLRRPAAPASPPPRIVFASLKGGVGRSTALSVVALHLANQGRRVLVIDLDMEAPGISTMLLTTETTPRYGIVDALVENGTSGLDDSFMQDLIGSSHLAEKSGRVDVIPAFGHTSIENPADVLGKLARAYTEDLGSDGKTLSILDQVRGVVDHFSDLARYDAILVDARAGLHETAASAILGLGADLLFFGLNEDQTFHGYRALFAHLARVGFDSKGSWLDQITMVQAKALATNEDQESFAERCTMLFQSSGLIEVQHASASVFIPAEPFRNVPWEDENVALNPALEEELDSRAPLVILDDERFKHYSPQMRTELMLPRLYQSTFGPLLDWIDETLSAATEDYGKTQQ